MCGVWLRSFQACQHAHQLETGNTSDPTWSYRVVLQTVVWAMVSRQVTIVGSGMRRIDDRGRHVRRDVGRVDIDHRPAYDQYAARPVPAGTESSSRPELSTISKGQAAV